jgi:hypothetical protein
MAIWMLAAGGAILALVTYDALSTTLATGRSAGPITGRLGRAWWALARRAARGPRSPWVASSGPVVVVLTILVWLSLLWAGWSLIFSADPTAVISSATREPADGWSRIYFAGFTAFTLGVGDYIPSGDPWQILTSVSVISGLALTTTAISYLIPVITAVTERRTQASTIAGLGPTSQDIILGGWRQGSFSFIEQRLPRLSEGILLTAERHLSYPILHYFHSPERRSDLRVQLYALDEAVTILQHAIPDEHAPHPAILSSVRNAVCQLLDHVMSGHATTDPAARGAPPPPAVDRLRDAGMPVVNEATFRERVQGIDAHRRRLAAFADESRWGRQDPIEAHDRHG